MAHECIAITQYVFIFIYIACGGILNVLYPRMLHTVQALYDEKDEAGL